MTRKCLHCGERFEIGSLKECSTPPEREGAIRRCEAKPWGYAAMSPERRKACASQGARKVNSLGLGHKWDSEEARVAGQRGGLSPKRKRSGCKPNNPHL